MNEDREMYRGGKNYKDPVMKDWWDGDSMATRGRG